MSLNNVPETYKCPISHEIMKNPYIDPDGNSYEREAIMDWLERNATSPITRRPMNQTNLVPNRALKQSIQEFLTENGFNLEDESKNEFKRSESKADDFAIELTRKKLVLFTVIDTSGSMGEGCGGDQNNGNTEGDGFSRLDLVKHTLNTIITALTKYDKLCIIKFSNTAEVLCQLTYLNPANKLALIEKVKYLAPDASTNLWDGLKVAFDQIARMDAEDFVDANVDIFLLTDGVPNIHPPRPILDTIENYMNKHIPMNKPRIHTFGYGYALESDMLYRISTQHNGCFGFIPDASMVGTVFINSLSDCLVGKDPALLSSPVIQMICAKFVDLATRLQSSNILETDYRANMILSFSDDVEEELQVQRTMSPTVDERGISFLQALLIDCRDSTDPNLGQIYKACQTQFYKKWGVHYIYSVMSAFSNKACINFKDKAIQVFKSKDFMNEQERIEDVFLAIPPPTPSNRYNYGSRGGGYYGGSSTNTPAAPVQMQQYFNVQGGCFTKESFVYKVLTTTTTTMDHSLCSHHNDIDNNKVVNNNDKEDNVQYVVVEVKDLLPGDLVMTHKGISTVECIVSLKYSGPLYTIGNMSLTAYHPITLPNQPTTVGVFPCMCEEATCIDFYEGYVYDVVLQNRGILACPYKTTQAANTNTNITNDSNVTNTSTVSGISIESFDASQCMYVATFGHCYSSKIFTHDYFGSEKIVNDLKQHTDWNKGYIKLSNYEFIRDIHNDNQVIGLSLKDTYNPVFSGVSLIPLASPAYLVI